MQPLQQAHSLLKNLTKRPSLEEGSALEVPRPVATPPEARKQQFQALLLADKIDLRTLKKLSFNGVPDKPGLRALTWKLLLGYLPVDPTGWDEALARKRTQYLLFCEELIVDPKKGDAKDPLQQENECSGADEVVVKDVTFQDHPLAVAPTSQWHQFFKDNEILEQIDRDVMRTHPDMHFFSGDGEDSEAHRKDMKRALFIFAKLNPGLRYIQGMNELYAPLYYIFKTDSDKTSAKYAEGDAFYCFVDLISEFRDHFCQQLDNSQVGIKAVIWTLMQLLQHHDKQLWEHLNNRKVDAHFFAFRWITLLLTQEFAFPDALRIWDMLLSDPQGRRDCLLRICIAMLLNIREHLLSGDFTVIVKTLQQYPSVDVNVILSRAADLPPCSSILGRPV